MWLQACTFDTVLPQHTDNHVQQYERIVRNSFCEINLDEKLRVLLLGGL